jgi:hypothetical protein
MDTAIAMTQLGLPFSCTPCGAARTEPGTPPLATHFAKRITRNGGISITRVVAFADEPILGNEVWDSSGYAIVLLLKGAAMAGFDYVDEPTLIVVRPGSEFPLLHKSAEAIVISFGPANTFNPESRLRFSLSAAAWMDFGLSAALRSEIGRSHVIRDVDLADDVRLRLDSEGGGREAGRPHEHPSGGEMMLVLNGMVRERGPWELNAFDVLVYGPNSRHGPSVGPEGAITLTIKMGTYTK